MFVTPPPQYREHELVLFQNLALNLSGVPAIRTLDVHDVVGADHRLLYGSVGLGVVEPESDDYATVHPSCHCSGVDGHLRRP